jgi:hypothetical protein
LGPVIQQWTPRAQNVPRLGAPTSQHGHSRSKAFNTRPIAGARSGGSRRNAAVRFKTGSVWSDLAGQVAAERDFWILIPHRPNPGMHSCLRAMTRPTYWHTTVQQNSPSSWTRCGRSATNSSKNGSPTCHKIKHNTRRQESSPPGPWNHTGKPLRRVGPAWLISLPYVPAANALVRPVGVNQMGQTAGRSDLRVAARGNSVSPGGSIRSSAHRHQDDHCR